MYMVSLYMTRQIYIFYLIFPNNGDVWWEKKIVLEVISTFLSLLVILSAPCTGIIVAIIVMICPIGAEAVIMLLSFIEGFVLQVHSHY